MGRKHKNGKLGYCTSCMKNIPHVRRVRNPIAYSLDLLTIRLARFFRIGPWYCVQCGTRELLLPGKSRKAETYFPGRSASQAEKAGNYIRTTESLVMRRNRANRYSRKYRDGVVKKLISGTHTISQIGQELDLSERDIVDWIVDALESKQERIDELTAILRSVQEAHLDQAKLGYEPATYLDESGEPTFDGNYRAR